MKLSNAVKKQIDTYFDNISGADFAQILMSYKFEIKPIIFNYLNSANGVFETTEIDNGYKFASKNYSTNDLQSYYNLANAA